MKTLLQFEENLNNKQMLLVKGGNLLKEETEAYAGSSTEHTDPIIIPVN